MIAPYECWSWEFGNFFIGGVCRSSSSSHGARSFEAMTVSCIRTWRF
jgi:hypothetical protein